MLKIKRSKNIKKYYVPHVITFEGTLYFTSTVTIDDHGDYILHISDGLIGDMGWEITDTLDIERIRNTHSLEVKSLSFLKLKTSVFKRNLNGLLKKISNTEHPLKRIYIECSKPFF
ncbi:MAG: hypothetical protein COB45_14190 [Gammaproteobacteria bacterium]|nr:MAG: hypothetical protein COB45_14190 [Gammaproteobacteria bacterium]PHR84910.1 MAG: hypothetical protein COA59_03460 [Colwellia sp.]